MVADMQSLYGAYVEYFSSLRDDFDRHVDANVGEKYRPQRLNYDDFCNMWLRFGGDEALRQTWSDRLATGYRGMADAMGKQLLAAFISAGAQGGDRSLGRAA